MLGIGHPPDEDGTPSVFVLTGELGVDEEEGGRGSCGTVWSTSMGDNDGSEDLSELGYGKVNGLADTEDVVCGRLALDIPPISSFCSGGLVPAPSSPEGLLVPDMIKLLASDASRTSPVTGSGAHAPSKVIGGMRSNNAASWTKLAASSTPLNVRM